MTGPWLVLLAGCTGYGGGYYYGAYDPYYYYGYRSPYDPYFYDDYYYWDYDRYRHRWDNRQGGWQGRYNPPPATERPAPPPPDEGRDQGPIFRSPSSRGR
ncbi:MAG: hypothetical protein JRJ59_02300 [Deltaproteobacteria bacterium]|nr:hypothetical protein [Deltaproteobacteria bacterium]